MIIICKYNDPDLVSEGISSNFDYGLEIYKRYIVMGMALYKRSKQIYYLLDENGRPNWFPQTIFEIMDNSIPDNWFFKIFEESQGSDIYSVLGFDELCNEIGFYDKLIDREEEAMRVYYRRKTELEQANS